MGTSVMLMPLLGKAKRRLALRVASTAGAGEGRQNVLCGIQAAAVLVRLAQAPPSARVARPAHR